ncbi:MAG: lamin tail domain-containing protein [Methanobacteriota archaeon]
MVVNEVQYDPTTGDEWVELYNPTQIPYDISGWKLVDNTNSAVFAVPALTTLASDAYYVCNLSAPVLDNDDWVALTDSDGTLRDYVCWGIAEPFGATYDSAVKAQMWTQGTGFYVDTFSHVLDQTIGRDQDSNDSNSKFDWEITCGADASVPTPGARNLGGAAVWASQSVPLHVGWNLISLPLIQNDTSIAASLSSIAGKYNRVLAYDALDAADHWKQYCAFWPASLNQLNTIDHKIGFWLNVTQATTLWVNGTVPGTTSINLRTGWNLVGYPTLNNSTNVGTAFLGTGADIVEAYDGGQTYLTSVLAPTYKMKPGEAYWVHVPADTIWTVNW